MKISSYSFLLVLLTTLCTSSCNLFSRKIKYETTIKVDQSFSSISDKIDHNVKEDLEHGMTWSLDATVSKTVSRNSNYAEYEIHPYAFDIGFREKLATLKAKPLSSKKTVIQIEENYYTNRQKPYLSNKVYAWFPNSNIQRTSTLGDRSWP
ncbi:MAG: hypothetical protein ACSHXL_04330 [Bacteroidota bacterium]